MAVLLRAIAVAVRAGFKLIFSPNYRPNIGIALDETYYLYGKYLDLNAKVDYTAEKFYAWTKVGAWLSLDSDPVLGALPFECGIKSDAIIDKAEIGLKYTRADFAKTISSDKVDDAGLVTAYVKINFDSSAK